MFDPGRRFESLWLVVVIWAVLTCPKIARALDHVVISRDGREQHITGQILSDAVDGSLLVIDREAQLWAVQADELVGRTQDDAPYQPMQMDELGERLMEYMPSGSRRHATAHYLICYNTSPAYAQWCGALYERLYLAFCNYWERRGFRLKEPDTPLVALVFDTKQAYERYARPELGDAAGGIVGYYNLQTNRVAMYDLTGTNGLQHSRRGLTSTAQINSLLMRPEAYRMVATIIHEATHQLAYNCGLQTRLADIPYWVSEGLAVYFETPDLRSSRGWRNIGGVNRHRLSQFREYLGERPSDSLQTLLQDNKRFMSLQTGTDAYAEAWALNYYLIRNHREAYLEYMKILAQKPPVVYDTPQERLQEFQRAFGTNLDDLDEDFLRYIRTVR